ncbi:MAG: 8-oxo-dGTP diphosphatase MutT [Gammaproteobacteria bacterium]|nr:8-oxo-dGTP diphosphatase MutT [Chromatiales bacterium]MDP6675418.1 8-oxo-dGTP diphosphatase MutT [Gammaproteobacteria bacterium]
MNKPSINVAAGILIDDFNRVLIAERLAGGHQAGWWEFPGGKINAVESSYEGLVRELAEELGITVYTASELLTYSYEYPERLVKLYVFVVENYSGQPTGVEGQALRWEPVAALMEVGLLPADLPIVDALYKLRPDIAGIR